MYDNHIRRARTERRKCHGTGILSILYESGGSR